MALLFLNKRRLLNLRPRLCRFVSTDFFFNRKIELKGLEEETSAGRLLVVTGPPDSGKSRLLKKFVENQRRGEVPGYSAVIDMRSGASFTTAAAFCRAIKEDWLPSKDLLWESIKRLHTADPLLDLAKDVTATIAESWLRVQEAEDFPTLLRHLESLLFCYRSKAKSLIKGSAAGFPTLIIDEANRLHEWSLDPQEQTNLSLLQQFFVRITKQEHLANVILSTSEDLFRVWMNTNVGCDRYSVEVVGDFTKDEAFLFLQHALEQLCQQLGHKVIEHPEEKQWEDMFDITGGRAIIISNVASRLYHAGGSIESCWPSLKASLLWKVRAEMQRGFHPQSFTPKWACPPLGFVEGSDVKGALLTQTIPTWTGDEWHAVMKLMNEAENGVVSFHALLKQSIPYKSLMSMVQHNLLHYREAPSRWARDLEWYAGSWPIFMPRSRPHYHACRLIINEGV